MSVLTLSAVEKLIEQSREEIKREWAKLDKAKADFEEYKMTAFFAMLKEMRITVISGGANEPKGL